MEGRTSVVFAVARRVGQEPGKEKRKCLRSDLRDTILARTNKKGPLVTEGAIDLAASYSPTGSPLQYHRRWKA